MKHSPIPIWVLYDRETSDFPGWYVVRCQEITPDGIWHWPIGCLYATADEAISECEALGLTWLDREPHDEPGILGVFL